MLLKEAARITELDHYQGMANEANQRGNLAAFLRRFGPETDLAEITTEHIRAAISEWRAAGNKPATIHVKLCTLSVLFQTAIDSGWGGDKPKIPRVHLPRRVQWYLDDKTGDDAIAWAEADPEHAWFADYIRWTTWTGLRVRETLAVRRHHFQGLAEMERPSLTVPGKKTSQANAAIPLPRDAAILAANRMGDGPEAPLFAVNYKKLVRTWDACRDAIGLADTPGATLKAFRRSAARYHTMRGMPTRVLQRLLRHSNITTTEGYLRLVGDFSVEDMRRFMT